MAYHVTKLIPSCHSTSEITSGENFIVYDQAELAKEILPKFFKHSNFASFVRQLNMYGFRKIASADQGSLRSAEREHLEFTNPNFQKNKFFLIDKVKRKISSNVRTAAEEQRVKSEDVERLLSDMHEMRGRQVDVDQQIEKLTKDKDTMWDEVSRLRQMSDHQQVVINKLVHFLLRLLYTKTERLGPVGRKRPLALREAEADVNYASSAKIVALPDEIIDGRGVMEDGGPAYTVASPTSMEGSVPDIVMNPNAARVAMPVSLMDGSVGTLAGAGTDFSMPVSYTSSAGLPASSRVMTEAQGVACRPQTVNIQPQSDVVALQNWDMSPTSAHIASLLTDGPVSSLVPQAPDYPVTDVNSLMEHLDCLNEGIDSVRNVIKTSDAFDQSLVQDLFTADARSPAATLDSNTQSLLDALAAGEEPSEIAVRGLHQCIQNDGLLLPIGEYESPSDNRSASVSPAWETGEIFTSEQMNKAIVPVTGAQSIPHFGWISCQSPPTVTANGSSQESKSVKDTVQT